MPLPAMTLPRRWQLRQWPQRGLLSWISPFVLVTSSGAGRTGRWRTKTGSMPGTPFPNPYRPVFRMDIKRVVCPSAVFPQADGRKPVMALPYQAGTNFRRRANHQLGVVRSTEEYEPGSWSCRSWLIGHSRLPESQGAATRRDGFATRQNAPRSTEKAGTVAHAKQENWSDHSLRRVRPLASTPQTVLKRGCEGSDPVDG
jgi:hypothetical protein